MKTTKVLVILVFAMGPVVWSGQAAFAGSIVGWGAVEEVPAGNDFVAIAAGNIHSLALKSDGSIVGWGANSFNQATPPAGYGFVAIAAGGSHSLALRSDGSIVGWGYNSVGQATPPLGNDFVAIAAGYGHSLALKSDGSIVGWGDDTHGQATPPLGNDFVAIGAGMNHSLALKSDGSIVGWGHDFGGKATGPEGNDFVAIAVGMHFNLALRSDGSIVGWGANSYNQATPPEGNDFVAIAAGSLHSLAIKSDGLIVGWGCDYRGQITGLGGNNFVAIAGGDMYSLAIKVTGNDWIISEDNMYSVPTGNVGIGTTSPACKLHVSGGNIRIDYPSGIDIIQQNGYISRIDSSRNDLAIWNLAAGDIKFLTGAFPNNTHPRLLIANDGNLGIGTTSPSEKLDVAGAANLNKGISTGVALRVNGAEALWYNGDYFSWGFGGTANFFADSVGIGQVDPGPHKLYVNGTGYATGGFWASDLRFKKNIKTIDSPIDKISKIRGVSFEWRRSEYEDKGFPAGEHYGVIAQEIEELLPEIVKEGPNGDKAVSYIELVPILTEAIKEQQKQLEEQQRQVEYLLQRVESMERIAHQQ